ncbi:MAG: methyltransferase domain-containing protein [Candidatus Colwellbacteria bacterium]|jgi:ubiquinone/menaquinone biosynthesis C-methylase UbiE|nr:methyltransferase domain-containing protein [Candidatus Colwellbacteria bacterium]MDD3752560.1 methyltransferase domain-containing protein [Candidatus Colwellbacteria bacterium]MDD4818640.1 methyltransferase domain-containing protein [Candidatus Colwellbacteria bacterium]
MASPKKENTSWGKVASWYDEAVSQKDSYQKSLILPNILRMSEVKKGDNVIDIACGTGFFSIELSKTGASVVGVDISQELLEMAKSKKSAVEFIKASAEDLSLVKKTGFDKAFIVLALQNINNAKKALSECSLKLKTGGKLYIVLNHPCFRIPEFSSWGWDGDVQYRKIERYLSETKTEIQMHPGADPKIKTLSFHRPLQYYFKSFEKAGFAATRIEEWNSNKESEPGPRAGAENRARKEIPLFMAIECMKL